jgi:hypothetical protein
VALPVGQGPPTPAAVARALLDRVVAYYAEHADPSDLDAPVPLPARRFVAGGEPRVVAWDTDLGQVHVAYERTFRAALDPTAPAAPARVPRTNPANRGNLARTVTLEVQIVRPAPGLGQLRALPTEDELDRHGHAIGLDLHHVVRAATRAAVDGHLTRENVAEARVDLGDAVTLGPSGNVAGVGLAVTIPLL